MRHLATRTVSKQHFGLLAHSSEGAALCFQTFCREGFARLGAHMHPDVTLDCIAMGEAMPAWGAGDYASIRKIFETSVDRLAKAGADFFACPDNTAHMALEHDGAPFPIPALHIADVVADAAKAQGLTKIAILGTNYTMEGPVYPRAFASRGLAHAIPETDERKDIHRIIFDELVEGKFTDEARQRYVSIIERLTDAGCDGAALVCTEIPLLVTPDVSPIPVLDSTRLLARSAFEVAIGAAPLPTWRGGPVGQSEPARA